MHEQNELSTMVGILMRLLALSIVENKETLRQKIELLGRAGLKRKCIAELLGTTANTVSVQLSRERRAKSRKSRKRSQEPSTQGRKRNSGSTTGVRHGSNQE